MAATSFVINLFIYFNLFYSNPRSNLKTKTILSLQPSVYYSLDFTIQIKAVVICHLDTLIDVITCSGKEDIYPKLDQFCSREDQLITYPKSCTFLRTAILFMDI